MELPASYPKHMIGTYSSLTDAVICIKIHRIPSHIYCNQLSVRVTLIYFYHHVWVNKLPANVSEVHLAYCIHFYLEVAGVILIYWGVTESQRESLDPRTHLHER